MNTWIFSHCISFCFLPIPNFGLCSPTMASFTTLAVFSMGSTAPTARLKDGKDYTTTQGARVGELEPKMYSQAWAASFTIW